LRLLPLLIATLVVGVGIYFVGLSAIDGMQRAQAEYAAQSFGKYLVQQVPDLAGVIANGRADPAAAAALSSFKPIGTIIKFRIFDRTGNLRVDSSPFAAAHIVTAANSFEDLEARRVGSSGRSAFNFREGDGSYLPLYYSDIMVPLTDNGRTIGVLSVLSDETQARPDLLARFRTVAWQVLLLIVVAFGVPVTLYVRKLIQLESTRRRLRHSALHDSLTGLLNRTGFLRRLDAQIATADRHGFSVAVHVIDLDRFNDVNERIGHGAGDAVLKQAARRIEPLLGPRALVARLGADEFAILQPYYLAGLRAVDQLADDVASVLAQPFRIGEATVQLGASIGHASYPFAARESAELMRAADIARHYAKLHARGRSVAFVPSMDAERQNRHRIDARLRAALAGDEFELYFQPVSETATGRLCGFEALLRLSDDAGVPIPPSDFIPVAEETGLIDEIDAWVLRKACRLARQWPEELFVAVNLSPAQFRRGDMAERIRETLAWSGLDPKRLEIEVTEGLLITDSEAVLRQLDVMKALGIRLALDDFGTGYSSLSYLWRFPFDKLKVDRSFMIDLVAPGSKSREIVATIIALGRVLNLTVTAEGVETEAQAAMLRELNCDLVQGYLFGRPQPASEVAATILKSLLLPSLSHEMPSSGNSRRAG
jgi:diguanylate cyclase (GGDEF)-like protein